MLGFAEGEASASEASRKIVVAMSVSELIEAALVLDNNNFGQAGRLAQALLCDELERRFPEVGPAMQAWADDPDEGHTRFTYVQALVAAVEESQGSTSSGTFSAKSL
jgi:hypothetical protein